jgi:hypothetical protein
VNYRAVGDTSGQTQQLADEKMSFDGKTRGLRMTAMAGKFVICYLPMVIFHSLGG